MLARLGVWCFSNPRKTLAVWVALIAAVVVAMFAVGSRFDTQFDAPASDSRNGREVLEEHFGELASRASGAIVFRAESGVHDPQVRAAIEQMLEEVAAIEGVTVSSPYAPEGLHQISADGRIAYANVNFSPDVDFGRASEIGAGIGRLRRISPACRLRSPVTRLRSSRRPSRSSSASPSPSSC